jgi:hypothetical protein
MSIRTTALIPFPVTSIPDRNTPVLITDKSKVTASTTTTAPVLRLNRLQSASFGMSTDVMEMSEMGTQNRVGGVDDLGEAKYKLEFEAVGINNLANLCGVPVSTTSGATTSIGLTQFQQAQIDFIRLVASGDENVFASMYLQDCIIDDYSVDVKEKGSITESFSGRGPNATYFPGFFIPKNYVVQSADVAAGYIPTASVLGADEQPVEIFIPATGQPPSYWQQNGSQYFLKIERIPGANTANAAVRYFENNPNNSHVATYDHTTGHLTLSDTLVAGDLIRFVFCSYNTDCLPTAIPATTPDTTDRPGISSRLVPIKIGAGQFYRVQSVSMKFSLKRDHVQGVGENSIIYGVSSIPDVTVSFDVKESDMTLLNQLQNNTTVNTNNGGTIKNDFLDLNYLTRTQLDPANAIPFNVQTFDPYSVGEVLVAYNTPQLVVKDIDYASTNKADNTIKVSAIDIQGILNISFTHP